MSRFSLVTGALALVLSACGGAPNATSSASPNTSPGASPAIAAGVPRCDALPTITAPDEAYRDEPIYVFNEMPVEDVMAWAQAKPGFETLWVDRDRHGWITLAFSEGAAARQAELATEFPGVGVVAVPVEWTLAELEALQTRVVTDLLGPSEASSSGISVTQGVVSIDYPVLTAEHLAEVEARFGGERVCVAGADPAAVVPPGPQVPGGDGWRLLAAEEGVGQAYRTGIATDAASYAALWEAAGVSGEPPAVDFQSEVAIWFGAVYGSSCPGLRLDDVVVDRERAIVHGEIVLPGRSGMCTADANPHAFVVAVPRAALPAGPFWIQLGAEDPPGGVPEERTIVEVPLTEPGSVAGPADLRPGEAVPDPPQSPGAFIEPEFAAQFRTSVRCGIEWLGPLNEVMWRTAVPAGTDPFVPEPWLPLVVEDSLTVEVLVTAGPPASLTATANGHKVVYEPSPDAAPPCP